MKDRAKEFFENNISHSGIWDIGSEDCVNEIKELMADFAKAEVLREIDLLRSEVNKAQIFTDINEAFINSIKRIESEPKY